MDPDCVFSLLSINNEQNPTTRAMSVHEVATPFKARMFTQRLEAQKLHSCSVEQPFSGRVGSNPKLVNHYGAFGTSQ